MMDKDEIVDVVKHLSKNERLILATFEGSGFMPEYAEKFWNAKALESLVDMEIIKWTVDGYELTASGLLLGRYIHEMDKE